MLMTVKQFGNNLASRDKGASLRKMILTEITSDEHSCITFDFTDVNSVSSSFADEAFGKIAEEIGFNNFKQRTTFSNVNKINSTVILNAIVARSNLQREI